MRLRQASSSDRWPSRLAIRLAVIGLWALALPVQAAEPVTPAERAEVAKLVSQLDAPQYDQRQLADERLRTLLGGPNGAALTQNLREMLLGDSVSYETRSRLLPLMQGKSIKLPTPPTVPTESVQQAIRDVDSDKFTVRSAAATRLRWMLEKPEMFGPVALAIKLRLADQKLSLEARRQLEPLWQTAYGRYLIGGPSNYTPPEVSAAQIEEWVRTLEQPLPPGSVMEESPPHRYAYNELLELLARDDYLPRVRLGLEKHLAAGDLDRAAADRLQAILQWTRPAMVAEIWTGGRILIIQHLLIDVPNHAEGAPRPSHFDYCDDVRAHCVSGNSLQANTDYPVNVLFPHPRPPENDGQFQLINLPTPRRRLAYEYDVRRPESVRLAEATERTLKYLTHEDRLLTEREIIMLRSLDPHAVSRFVGPYLAGHDDAGHADNALDLAPGAASSRHNLLAVVLATMGTHEAAPGLLSALKAKKFLPPTPDAPYKAPFIALLAIAERDPWLEADAWLLTQVPKAEPLVLMDDEGQDAKLLEQPLSAKREAEDGKAVEPHPELGATAAAILLKRHGQSPAAFGLEPVESPVVTMLGCPSFRFKNPQKAAEVVQWWSQHKDPADRSP